MKSAEDKNEAHARTTHLLKTLGTVAWSVYMLWPTTTLSAPSWRVTVVDAKGHPVSGAMVRESWQNYSFEVTSHEVDRFTDRNGFLSLPPQYLRMTRLLRVLRVMQNSLGFVHANWGAESNLLVFYNKYEIAAPTWKTAPEHQSITITLQPRTNLLGAPSSRQLHRR